MGDKIVSQLRRKASLSSNIQCSIFRSFILSIVLVLMVWFVFGQTLTFDFVNYDDPLYVTENPLVSSGITLKGFVRAIAHSDYSFYHPLTTLSHMLDYEIYGLNPVGFHLTNVVLHTASTLLLFLILRSMTGSLWKSFLVAAVFAIHPLRAESVAWITERKDCLSGFFFMLTLASYVRYVRRPFSVWRYGLVFVCMAACMLSKATVVTLPFVLLLLDFWPLQRFGLIAKERTERKREDFSQRRRVRRFFSLRFVHSFAISNHLQYSTASFQRYCVVLEKMPFFLLSAGVAFVMISTSGESISSIENVSFLLRFSNAACSYTTYLMQSIFPLKLAVFYPYPVDGLPVWRTGFSLILLLGLSWFALKKIWQSPFLAVGWFWYLGMLLPVIGVVQAGQQAHADRYTYLSQIGLTWAVVWFLSEWMTSKKRRVFLSIFVLLGLVALMSAARTQAACWRDSVSLWAHSALSVTPNGNSINNFGYALMESGDIDRSTEQFAQALLLDSSDTRALNGIGMGLIERGDVDGGIEFFKRALRWDSDDVAAHNNLGLALKQTGEIDAAIEHYKRAIAANPERVEAYNNLAGAYAEKGDVVEGVRCYQRALEIAPFRAILHKNLAVLLTRQEETDDAILHFEAVLEIDPYMRDAYTGLAKLLAQKGEFQRATLCLQQALERYPMNDTLHCNLGLVFEVQGLLDSAIKQYEKALSLSPASPQAQARRDALLLNSLTPERDSSK